MSTSVDKPEGNGAVVQPSPRQVFSDPVMLLAFGFGSGLSPKAPGTAGSLLALLIYLAFMRDLSPLLYLGFVLLATVLGVYLCHAASRKLGVHDHGGIVWDEFRRPLADPVCGAGGLSVGPWWASFCSACSISGSPGPLAGSIGR